MVDHHMPINTIFAQMILLKSRNERLRKNDTAREDLRDRQNTIIHRRSSPGWADHSPQEILTRNCFLIDSRACVTSLRRNQRA